MRFLYSVHRYGEEIVGGAETACRGFAERLVSRGHEVTVLTSCALHYDTWSDHYSPGESTLNGVKVVRLPVEHSRDPVAFAQQHEKILRDPTNASFGDQVAWLSAMGPMLKSHHSALVDMASSADAAVFMTYLYPTSVFGVSSLAGRVPTLLQPTAHDEPPAQLPIFRSEFHAVDGLLYLTEEEKAIARRLFHADETGTVTGLGVDLDGPVGDGATFRQVHGLGDDPYVIYVGRLDVFKGVSELMRYFVEYKGRNRSNLRLVLAGEQMMPLPEVNDIRHVGFLSEEEKRDAIAGSVALVQPSPYESFSIVLLEAWLQKRPVLVQQYSEVLTGQCMRSGGGLPYRGFAEFEACLDRLVTDSELAHELGENGQRYTRSQYSWDSVLGRFEAEVSNAIERFTRRI